MGFRHGLLGVEQREAQYVACDHLVGVKDWGSPRDLPQIERFVVTKSWWDTVDQLDAVVGAIIVAFPEAKAQVRAWAVAENFWLRRVAIDCQLSLKEKLDPELLAEVIIKNLGSDEFFINKAIGWALRQHARIAPDWVRAFVAEYRGELAPLSVREALKHLEK